MERLTKRDCRGQAYFDDDGALIRGANGAFHQKKEMTSHFIHQRFVALDKTIDRLAAYEDTGLNVKEALDLAGKYTPKKPIKVSDGGMRYTSAYRCPSCGGAFTGTGIADYCYHCGQRLDWEIGK